MKTTQSLLVAVAAFALFGCTTSQHGQRWDYKIISGPLSPPGGGPTPLRQQLDSAATEGWEVVTSSSDEGRPLIILRRPK